MKQVCYLQVFLPIRAHKHWFPLSEGSGYIFTADPNMFKQARVMQTSILGSVDQCFYVNQP